MKLKAGSCLDESILNELIATAQEAVTGKGRTTALGRNYGVCVYGAWSFF